MSRLTALDFEFTNDTVETLLERIREETGMVPAIYRVIANSTAALAGFLAMKNCLDAGMLDKRLRSQIALAVSQANASEYCVAAYTALGKAEGLSEEALRDARQANTPNRRTHAALKFSKALGERPVQPLDELLLRLRNVGFTEAEIAEIIAHTALVNLTNYFFHASAVTLDFTPIDLPKPTGRLILPQTERTTETSTPSFLLTKTRGSNETSQPLMVSATPYLTK